MIPRFALLRLLLISTAGLPLAAAIIPATPIVKFVPHIASGTGFQTNITITNLAQAPNQVTVNTVSQSGVLVSSTTYVLSPNSAVQVNTDPSIRFGPAIVDWAVIGAQAAIGVDVFYELQAPTGDVLDTVGYSDIRPSAQFTFSVDLAQPTALAPGGHTAGVAVANVSSANTTVTLTLRDSTGVLLATSSLSLGGYQQSALVLNDIPEFGPILAEKQIAGALEVSASSPITALAVNYDNGSYYGAAGFPSLQLAGNFSSAGASGFALSVTGSTFPPGTSVYWNGILRPTSLSPDGSSLTASINPGDLANVGLALVDVITTDGSTMLSAAPFLIGAGAGLPIMPSATILRIIPHVVNGGGFVTHQRITNLSGQTNIVNTYTFTQSGNLEGAETFTLESNAVGASDFPETQRFSPQTVSWTVVEAQGPVGVNVSYDLAPAIGAPVTTSVGFSDIPPAKSVSFPVVLQKSASSSAPFRTAAFAVANVSNLMNPVSVTLLDSTGTALASYTTTLGPLEQTALQLLSLPAFQSVVPASGLSGTVWITSAAPFSAIALGDDNGPLYATPPSVLAPPTALGAGTQVVIAPPVSSAGPSNGTVQLAATVTGTTNAAVLWSVNGIEGGNASVGTITPTGLFTAPLFSGSSSAPPQNVLITALSVADPTQSASARLTVNPAATSSTPAPLSVLPPAAILNHSQIRQFSVTAADGSTPSVTWSWSPQIGSLSSSGLYTAPDTIAATQTITITAKSTDSTLSASAVLTLAPVVLLNWMASVSPNIAGYNVYRSTASGGPYTKVNTSLISGTTFTDTSVPQGPSYYVATAVDFTSAESGYSVEIPVRIP